MNPRVRSSLSSTLAAATLSLTACLACTGPLPAENPQTEPAEPAGPASITVDSTSAPTSSATEAAPTQPPAPPVFKGIGLETPESVLYDANGDVYLVSNINGSPSGKDNNGFISQLNPDGSVKTLKFIAGGVGGAELSAPKGLLIVAGTLYVSDIDHVRKFDLATGAAKGYVHFPKATFLNDLAIDSAGVLYVSDTGVKAGAGGLEATGTDTVYKLDGDKISVLAKGKELAWPNGLWADQTGLLMVTLNANKLMHFDAKGKVSKQVELPTGGLDGIVALADGSYLISSWAGKQVFRGSLTEPFTVVAKDVESPADIGFDSKRNRILIPLFLKNEVHTVELPAAVPAPNAAAAPAASAPASTSPSSAATANPTGTP